MYHYHLQCLICNEEFHGGVGSVTEFIHDHIHDNQTFIKCCFCEVKSQLKIKELNIDPITSTKKIRNNTEGIYFYWENHKCDNMELQELEFEEKEREKEEREEVMADYRAHSERY
jgi:hypothetical protein